MNSRETAKQIFLAGIESVVPRNLMRNQLALTDGRLRIYSHNFDLGSIKNIYVIGAGKASAIMAYEVEKVLGDRISGGHISVKYGFVADLNFIKVTEAGHPVPDSKGYKAAREIIRIAQNASENDLVICLISGGGSALLPDAPDGCTSRDMIKLNKLLVNSGACISEINAVRKHLSKIKGGQLARIVYPATLVNIMLSDVPGDPPEVIASGPTVPDSTTFSQAMVVLNKFNLREKVPPRLIRYLEEGILGLHEETPKSGDVIFTKTFNILAGSNRTALEAALNKALSFSLKAVVLDHQLQGDIQDVAEYLVGQAMKFKSDIKQAKPLCLLFGGETTVKMTGKGKGGRNQHLALAVALLLQDKPGITILCGGTDGNDGPTDAAGAVVDSDTIQLALGKNIQAENYLKEFDSYNFFRKVGGHILTGPTMTNVMDIVVVIVG